MIIVGITGTIGAGKGAVVDYLKARYNFAHYSARDFLIAEIKKRNLPLSRESMASLANTLRHEHGSSFIIEELYKEAEACGTQAIIESIRTKGEIDSLRNKKNFSLIAVDAPVRMRYERILGRKSVIDDISFETFLADEAREMNSIHPSEQNLAYCISQADHCVINDGSLEELHQKIDTLMQNILHT